MAILEASPVRASQNLSSSWVVGVGRAVPGAVGVPGAVRVPGAVGVPRVVGIPRAMGVLGAVGVLWAVGVPGLWLRHSLALRSGSTTSP